MNIVRRVINEECVSFVMLRNKMFLASTFQVNSHLLYKIGGLCGYYSGNQEDDQRKPDGKRAFTSKDFGDSWEIEERTDDCKPLICPHEEMSKSMELCHKLK